MYYLEMKNKLQKTLSILEKKRWHSRKELEQAAIISIKDFCEKNGLPPSEVEASKISLVPPDYPSASNCLYTYQFVFKSDKRKPGGYSDYLLQVVLEPAVADKLWEMEIWDLFEYMNAHTAILHNEQMLLQEKENLVQKIYKVDKELKAVQEMLKKY